MIINELSTFQFLQTIEIHSYTIYKYIYLPIPFILDFTFLGKLLFKSSIIIAIVYLT